MKTRFGENGLFVPSKGLSASHPVESEISIQRADEQASADAQISIADRNAIRILIIDDDRTLREGCASVLLYKHILLRKNPGASPLGLKRLNYSLELTVNFTSSIASW